MIDYGGCGFERWRSQTRPKRAGEVYFVINHDNQSSCVIYHYLAKMEIRLTTSHSTAVYKFQSYVLLLTIRPHP